MWSGMLPTGSKPSFCIKINSQSLIWWRSVGGEYQMKGMLWSFFVAAISRKNDWVQYQGTRWQAKHARSKQIPGAGGKRIRTQLASLKLAAGSWHQSDSLAGFWPKVLALARVSLSCFVLPVLPCFGPQNRKKNFSGPEKCVSSPRLLHDLKPCQNELSSPGMLECLALGFVLDGCTWKNFSGPKKFFSTQLFSEPDAMPNEFSSPGMLECLALSSVLDGCTWKNFSRAKKFSFHPTLFWT